MFIAVEAATAEEAKRIAEQIVVDALPGISGIQAVGGFDESGDPL